jgi:hypothetical protein
MIIYHKNHAAAFTGAHITYQLYPRQRTVVTTAAAANNLIEQSRSISRFVFSRVFGRVN